MYGKNPYFIEQWASLQGQDPSRILEAMQNDLPQRDGFVWSRFQANGSVAALALRASDNNYGFFDCDQFGRCILERRVRMPQTEYWRRLIEDRRLPPASGGPHTYIPEMPKIWKAPKDESGRVASVEEHSARNDLLVVRLEHEGKTLNSLKLPSNSILQEPAIVKRNKRVFLLLLVKGSASSMGDVQVVEIAGKFLRDLGSYQNADAETFRIEGYLEQTVPARYHEDAAFRSKYTNWVTRWHLGPSDLEFRLVREFGVRQ